MSSAPSFSRRDGLYRSGSGCSGAAVHHFSFHSDKTKQAKEKEGKISVACLSFWEWWLWVSFFKYNFQSDLWFRLSPTGVKEPSIKTRTLESPPKPIKLKPLQRKHLPQPIRRQLRTIRTLLRPTGGTTQTQTPLYTPTLHHTLRTLSVTQRWTSLDNLTTCITPTSSSSEEVCVTQQSHHWTQTDLHTLLEKPVLSYILP